MSTHSLVDPRYRSLGGGYDEAVRQGNLLAQELWLSAEMLTTAEVAKLLNVTRTTIYRRRKAGKLLGLVADTTEIRYPSWQFDPDIFPYLSNILKSLRSSRPWGIYFFFIQKEPLLQGETPLQALKRKKCLEVMRVAKILGDDNE